jgi:hypothetical protein
MPCKPLKIEEEGVDMRVWTIGLLGLVILVGFSGCQKVGTVSGTVTADGEPVNAGDLVFKPLDGNFRPAVSEISSDGSYELITAGGKGLSLGRYQVYYVEPVQREILDEEGRPIRSKQFKWAGWQGPEEPVVVEPNENRITVELVKH